MATEIPFIEIENLSKDFGKFRAIDRLSLQINQGEIFGFLGPNGAGKTTTIRLLMGMLVPTEGRAKICGLDCHQDRVEVKRLVGYLPDNPAFYDYLRGVEILRFVGQMHRLGGQELEQNISGLLSQFSLTDAASEFAVNYSAGMKRKLAFACAIIHKPQILILDEPTTGLDPHASRDVINIILSYTQEGKTVFLSSHLLNIVEKLCHRVGIIDHGRLLTVGRPTELENNLCPGGSLEDVFFAVTREES
jgi:ABC-2 type transport system ATP-binding protein